MLNSIPRRRLIILVTAVLSAACLLSTTSCTQRGPSGEPARGGARISVMTSALSQLDITRVTLVVTGSNIAPPISVDLTRAEGSTQWAASVPSIPAGRQHFAAAFSDGGATPMYSGATDVTIVGGAKAQVVLVLQEANPASPLTHVAPVIDALTASRTVVGPGGAVELSLTAHDRNTPAEPLTYAWTASCSPGPESGAFDDASRASVAWTAPATEGQSCVLKAKVANVSTSREMSLAVTVPTAEGQGESDVVAFANTFPVIERFVADFSSSSAGRMQADLVLVATDPDGDGLRYTWASSCDGVFTFPSESTQPHVLFPVGVSDCVITAQVFDLCSGGNCGAMADGGSSDGADRGGVATAVVSTKGGAYSVGGVVTGPAAAVTMTLTGADTAVTMTDAAGSFSFFGLADGAYTVTPSRAGFGFIPASAAVVVSGGSVANLSFVSVAAAGFRSCKDVRQAGLPDGTYALDPDGLGRPVSVYCPASSENLAPVGLCQAEVGASPSCRSYVAAAGFDFAGVDFSKSLYYSNTTLALNGTIVPGDRDVILLRDGSLLTSTTEWDYLNRVTPDGTVAHFGGQLAGAVGLTQLYDRSVLAALGHTAKVLSLDGVFQRSVDAPTCSTTLAPSGHLWAPLMNTALIDLYLPDLTTVASTVAHTSASPWVPSVLALANGGFVVTNLPGVSWGQPAGPASLSFLRPDRTPVVFTEAPSGMTLNPDGTISRADMVLPFSPLQLPNGQILMSDGYTKKIFRFNEDGSFAEALSMPAYSPCGMALDRQGRLLVTTTANTLQVITFGQ